MQKTPPPFEPTSELERLLADAQHGRLPAADLMNALLTSQVYVLGDRDLLPDGSWDEATALLMLADPAGTPMLAMFTTPERATDWLDYYPQYTFGRHARFEWLVTSASADSGVVVNPGSAVGWEISPVGVGRLKEQIIA